MGTVLAFGCRLYGKFWSFNKEQLKHNQNVTKLNLKVLITS